MTDPRSFTDGFRKRHAAVKKPRVNWKRELKLERTRVLEEVRAALIDHKRSIPSAWEKGYLSALSVVERLKMEEKQ